MRDALKSTTLLSRGIRETLDRLYSQVPSTVCDNCGSCCELTVKEMKEGWFTMAPLYVVEDTNISDFVDSKLSTDYKNRLFGVRTERPQLCPFRHKTSARCIIYPVRPFVCRAYGVLNDEWIDRGLRECVGLLSPDWINAFRSVEKNSICPRIRVTEPEKLEAYLFRRIRFDFTRELSSLSSISAIMDGSKMRIFSEITGNSDLKRWTWGGFNVLRFSSEKWMRSKFPNYWKNSSLAG